METLKIRDFISKIEANFLPPETWDNCGLIVGSPERETGRLALVLDASPEALDEAVRKGCNTLITHHPIIFTPISQVDTSQLAGATIARAIKHDISIISFHTNWDKSGLNDALADLLGLRDTVRFPSGFGAAGELKDEISAKELSEKLKSSWGLSRVVLHNFGGNIIRRVAICGGSGGELWSEALSQKADIYITSEVKLHIRLAARAAGLCIMEADHAEMERTSLTALAKLIESVTGIKVLRLSDGKNGEVL